LDQEEEKEIRVGPLDRWGSPEFRGSVTIVEDSTIFQDLLSFIYPDKTPTIFMALTSLMPVLDAATKYDMKGVVGSLTVQLMKRIAGDPLMYQDPLWVYVKAKQLDLVALSNAAARATLSIDIHKGPHKPEVANAPASWILELVQLREEHSQWWYSQCRRSIQIANMTVEYGQTDSRGSSFYRTTACQCPDLHSVTTIKPPTEVVLKIMAHPCAKSVREIDFNRAFQCFRCGAAAAVHYKEICLWYEARFGKF
jgi:hypothetical protein